MASTLLCCMSPRAILAATPEQAVTLDAIKVTGTGADGLDAARKALSNVPGAGNVIDLTRVDNGRVAGTADVLAYQPGIYAQSPGNEGVKVSIRGSGINRAPGAHASGVSVSLDGLPLTFSGGTPYELLEPLWMSRVDVLRGANGFDRGALALGGAIDYVSRSGLDSPGFALRYEDGRFGYRKRSLADGGAHGAFDYYLALTDSRTDGYQAHAAGSGKGVMANLGWQLSPDLSTRLVLRYRETEHETPGRLTRAQIADDPRQANPAYVAIDARRPQPGSTWIGSITTLQLDAASTLKAGLVYHRFPMDLNESRYRQQLDYADLGATLDYTHRHRWFGRDSTTTVGLRVTHDLHAQVRETLRLDTNGYPAGTRTRDFEHLGTNAVVHVGNTTALTPFLHLVTGLALVHTASEVAVTWPASGGRLSEHSWDYAPRVGLTFQATPQVQVFGNLSRSVEPPHPWSMIWGSGTVFPAGSGAATGRQSTPVHLGNQTAATLELGARGDGTLGRWQLAAYQSNVHHELLSVEVGTAPDTYVAESNASPTVHRGIEAGLESTLWQAQGDRLSLRQAYTYSDFRYRHDARFGNNVLPGLPRHYYQAMLRYDHHSGVYAALDTESASRVAVDYANSAWAHGHTVFGARVGFAAPGGRWQTWLEARNLTGQRYAATITPGYDDAGTDAARATPGEGLGLYAGLELHFE